MLEQILGRPIQPGEADLMQAFAGWLATEGAVAGGIGPHEASRLWERHLLDSAAFSTYWPTPPQECLDLGSGVGLPGMVLAVLWPDSHMQLVDRSGRRVRLMRRAVRILGLSNVTVLEQDISELEGDRQALVMRATLPPAAAVRLCGELLAPGGQAVLGLSRSAAPRSDEQLEKTAGDGLETRVETVKVLDPPAWMLIMSKS